MDIKYNAPLVKEEVYFSYNQEKESRDEGFSILLPAGYRYVGEFSVGNLIGETITTVHMVKEVSLSEFLANCV